MDRLRALVVVGLAVPLVAFHIALKKQVAPEEVTHLADIANRPAVWQGRLAADFELKTLVGETFRMADHVGKEVVVLNFFATWCGPCRQEMPELARFVESQRGHPVRLLALDVEEKPELVHKFVADTRLTLDVAIDETGSVAQSYGIRSYPTTVVVGADGSILLHQSGAIRNADVTLGPVLRDALARIGRGEAISREAYLTRVSAAPPAVTDGVPELRGRALGISQRMDCPCGCDDKVAKCGCKTAKNVKRRLSSQPLEGRTDDEIAKALNREFCMGGM